MWLTARYLAPLSIAAAGMLVAAPLAFADDGSASSTIGELKAEGYTVQINWVNGFDTEPLSQCVVTAVNNPNDSRPTSGTFATVYVDVSCPNHPDD